MNSPLFRYEDFCRVKTVSRETFLKFESYIELLKKWQRTINLVSNQTLSDIWSRHIFDSYQLVDWIKDRDEVADIGSGAGFPGMVLAIAGCNMTLIESDTRKIAFLREAARITQTNVALLNQRVEDSSLRNFSTITSRGFASMAETLSICSGSLTINHNLLLLKGKMFQQEIDEARKSWTFTCSTYPSITDKEGAIVSLTNIQHGAAS